MYTWWPLPYLEKQRKGSGRDDNYHWLWMLDSLSSGETTKATLSGYSVIRQNRGEGGGSYLSIGSKKCSSTGDAWRCAEKGGSDWCVSFLPKMITGEVEMENFCTLFFFQQYSTGFIIYLSPKCLGCIKTASFYPITLHRNACNNCDTSIRTLISVLCI